MAKVSKPKDDAFEFVQHDAWDDKLEYDSNSTTTVFISSMQDIENVKRILKALAELAKRHDLHKRVLGRDLYPTHRTSFPTHNFPGIYTRQGL